MRPFSFWRRFVQCYLFIVDNMRIFGGIFYTKKGGIFCETVSVRSPFLPSKFHRTPKPSFPRVLFSENHRSIGENFKKQRVQKIFYPYNELILFAEYRWKTRSDPETTKMFGIRSAPNTAVSGRSILFN